MLVNNINVVNFIFHILKANMLILGQVVGYTYTCLAEFGSGFVTG